MTRLPIIPTIIVAAAVATMIALGIWQIRRADEKQALIASFQAAAGRPAIAWPSFQPSDDRLHYRRATGFCVAVTGWRAASGRNRRGEAGWSHIASCSSGGAEGPGMQVDMGWSRSHTAPAGWRGGEVTGVIAPDRDHVIRLVSDTAAPGLEPGARPDPTDLPNNHLMYAGQWFFFAAIAAIIYFLALRRRRPKPDDIAPPPATP